MNDYPFYQRCRDRLKLPGGRAVDELTLEAVRAGTVRPEELGIAADTLQAQAEVSEGAGFPQLAANLRRAAELTRIPDDKILSIYDALRPGRADASVLEGLARELEEVHEAPLTARFVREAAASLSRT